MIVATGKSDRPLVRYPLINSDRPSFKEADIENRGQTLELIREVKQELF